MDEVLLDIRNARVVFTTSRGLWRSGVQTVSAVDGVDLQVGRNENVALVGESGSGKSTLALSALRLRSVTSGDILWRGRSIQSLNGEDLKAFRRSAQVVFQDPYGSLNPRLTIAETLRRPLALDGKMTKREAKERVEASLESVGLRPASLYANRFPHEFSGGQRQRIAIARALIKRPILVVADEAVSALDVSLRAQILALFQRLQNDLTFSLLFLSHDLGVVRFIADRVAVMYLGKIVEIGPADEIFLHSHHPYTKTLLAAAPTMRGRPPAEIQRYAGFSDTPVASRPAQGCRFRTRCPVVLQRCAQEEPLLRSVGPNRLSACHLD